jgi:hypothetical protein
VLHVYGTRGITEDSTFETCIFIKFQHVMTTHGPVDADDPTIIWASQHLASVASPASNASLSSWCQHLQDVHMMATSLDWTAFQVLTGDRANWECLARSYDAETVAAQWARLRHFEEQFWALEASARRCAYEVLHSHLLGNAPARSRLERFERLLQLDSGNFSDCADCELLVRRLVRICVGSPMEREVEMAELDEMAMREPIRWGRAASEVAQHPQYSTIAPSIIGRIAAMQSLSEPDRDRRSKCLNAFMKRFGRRILISKLKTLAKVASPLLPLAAIMAFSFCVIAQRELEKKRAAEDRNNEIWAAALEQMQQKSNSHLQTHLDPGMSVPSIHFPDEATLAKWQAVASNEGIQGLDKLQSELIAKAELVPGAKLSEWVDSNVEYRFFRNWREKVGDSIAQVADRKKSSR